MDNTPTDSLKMYFPNQILTRQTEKKKSNSVWELAEEDMSEQHKAIFRLKFFTDNFHIRILGMRQILHKSMGNNIFKCFLHPLENLSTDYFEGCFLGDKPVNETVQLQTQGSKGSVDKEIREFSITDEDKLRLTFKKSIPLFGMTLQVQLAADVNQDDQQAGIIAEKQIVKMCSYLAFKRKFSSGFGINSFLIMLEWDGTITPPQECLIKLSQMLFGTPVFDHITFIVPVKDLGAEKLIDWKSTVLNIQERISDLTGYAKEIIRVRQILMMGDGGVKDHNMVSNVLDLFRSIGQQTYRDPAPFEPVGLDFHEAKKRIQHAHESYQLRRENWYHVINSVYSMIPN